jgi:hypothetical protein
MKQTVKARVLTMSTDQALEGSGAEADIGDLKTSTPTVATARPSGHTAKRQVQRGVRTMALRAT